MEGTGSETSMGGEEKPYWITSSQLSISDVMGEAKVAVVEAALWWNIKEISGVLSTALRMAIVPPRATREVSPHIIASFVESL